MNWKKMCKGNIADERLLHVLFLLFTRKKRLKFIKILKITRKVHESLVDKKVDLDILIDFT